MFAEAVTLLPGGVDSPVRAFKAVGGEPLFIDRGEGPFLYDVETQVRLLVAAPLLLWAELRVCREVPAFVRRFVLDGVAVCLECRAKAAEPDRVSFWAEWSDSETQSKNLANYPERSLRDSSTALRS